MVQLLPVDATTLVISAESIGELYEFVRNGNTYKNFLSNLEIIAKYGIKYRFAITVSNLNIHGLKQFQDELATTDDYLNILVDPVFLSPHVLDPKSRDDILATNFKYNKKEIHQALLVESTDEQVQHLKTFLPEFVKRRNLSFDVFPESFTKWILE
jgi:sulfatase maturation enzyme AslB (radical SAM superfamily)